jgi:UDP-glucose 4-epimerase
MQNLSPKSILVTGGAGLIGETPQGIPNNLLPYVSRVAAGTLECLNVFGDDYPTPDGTGVRDYIHVMDLAEGHGAALKYLESRHAGIGRDPIEPIPLIVNLGAGRGYSVLEVVRAFEKAANRKISYRITNRRSGDIAASYADPSLACRTLKWQTTRDLDEMCADAWRFTGAHNTL